MFRQFYILTLLLFVSLSNFSQEEKDSIAVYHDTSKYVHFYSYANPLMLEVDPEIDDVNRKIRKKKTRGFLGIFKKRIYFGHQVRRGFTRNGYGRSYTTESFHTLKHKKKPSIYVREIYWFDYRKRKIQKTRADRVDPDFGLILHGPYKKQDRDGNILEEGNYFIGTKHKVWMRYGKNKQYTVKDTIELEGQVLYDKVNYYKGWPADAEITYYDKEKTKVKEVIPIVYGKKEGEYYKFYKNGWYAHTGFYKNDKKTGVWTEYWAHGRRTSLKKKQVKYPDSGYDTETPPILQKEWNKKGQVTFELKKKRR